MKNCKICGMELDRSDTFCPNCGSTAKRKYRFSITSILLLVAMAFSLTACGDDPKFYIGDTVNPTGFSITVIEVENTNSVGSSLLGDTTQNNFMLISVTVKNTGNSEKTITSWFFTLYRDSSTYEPHSSGIYITDGFYALKTIGSNLSESFVVLFETPDTHTDSDYILRVAADTHQYRDIILKTKPE